MHRAVLVMSTAVLLLAAGAQAASAATVSGDTGRVTYAEAPGGEPNVLRVDAQGPTSTPAGAELVFSDVVPVTAGPGCTQMTTMSARCPSPLEVDVLLGALDDQVTIGEVRFANFLLSGGEGADTLRGSTLGEFFVNGASTRMLGGPGRDTYVDGGGFDAVLYRDKATGVTVTLDGVANDPDGEDVPTAIDALVGSPQGDTLTGSDGPDSLFGGDGADTVEGRDGDDVVRGEAGDDVQRGGAGSDTSFNEAGADRFEGGDGYDRYTVSGSDPVTFAPRTVSVTLDDAANDGGSGERDDIRTDVEDLSATTGDLRSRFTLVGDADVNVLNGSITDDVLDGGAGGDFLNGGDGADTVNAREGVGDRINCGAGTDTANVDPLDQVTNCETVNRAAAPAAPVAASDAPATTPAPDDRPPTAAFAMPGGETLLDGLRPSTISVTADDDRGVARVLLVDDGRVVGVDDSAPYDFAYQPGGDDVGRNTLVAIAVDGAEQTGSAVRPVRVERFTAQVRGRVAPARDRTAPFRFRVVGGVELPGPVAAADACRTGTVSVQVKRGTRTISTRRVRLSRTCGFSSTVAFRDRRRLGDGRLKVTVRFLGNAVLRPTTARAFGLRAG